uniref:Craniofacial development protein 2-like n=1 Tax=Nicotiana sylvestris TaxID=4096 RepID=A0A1U7WEL6_NICSY
EVGQGLGGELGCKGGKGNKGVHQLRIGSWNVGSLTGKSIELAKILKKRRVNIACVQETRWAGSSARDSDGYKLWNFGTQTGKNGVGILVDMELRESVVECIVNVVSAYAPHMGLDEEVKRRFWDGLDEIIRQVPPTKKLFIGGDFNGHIGSTAGMYDDVHEGFSFGERNGGRTSLLDFAKAFGLVVANSCLPKKEEHLRKKMSARERLRIRWRALAKDKAQELVGRLSVMGAWRSSGDANSMWSTTTNCIREAAREVLRVSTGVSGRHKGDW